MSVLILVLPFWILGILAGWFAPVILETSSFLLIIIWSAFLLLNLVSRCRLKGALNPFPFLLLVFIFLTSFLISFNKSGGDVIETDASVLLFGRVEKVWEKPNSRRIKLKVVSWSGRGKALDSGEMVLLMLSNDLADVPGFGTLIVAHSKLKRIERKTGPLDFPEKIYWASEGVRKKGWINAFNTIDIKLSNRSVLLLRASGMQDNLCRLLDNAEMAGEESSVVKAMLLGMKDDLPASINEVFRHTGISHLLAVSGLHVGLIYLIIIRLFFFVNGSRAKLLIQILAVILVWSYSFMTGFGPSVQRAAGMISLFALSKIFNRRVDPLQILTLSFLLQTALNPFSLFSFGFQLSYLAVAGIFIVYRPWTKLISIRRRWLKKIWDFAGVSLAAQSFSLPFILIYFHEFPLYFLLGNLLLVPIGLLVFYLGAIDVLLLSVGLPIDLLGHLLEITIRFMIRLGEGIASLPMSVLGFHSFSLKHLVAYYFIASVLILMKRISLYKRIIYILGFFLGLSIISSFIVN